mgnify:CR=1 FL=1
MDLLNKKLENNNKEMTDEISYFKNERVTANIFHSLSIYFIGVKIYLRIYDS